MKLANTSRARLCLVGALALSGGCNTLDDLWNDATSPRPLDPAEAPNGPDDDAGAPTLAPRDAAARPPQGPDVTVVFPGLDDGGTDDAAIDDAATPEDGAAGDAAAEARPTVTALAFRTPIVELPAGGSRWVGYVRAGGRVAITRGPVGNEGCPARRDTVGAGWYEVEGGGYVCVGPFAALSAQVEGRAIARRLPTQPDLDASMPFPYAINWRPTVMYRWLPSLADEREVEPERFAPRGGADGGVAAVGDGGAPPRGDGGVRIEELEGAAGSPLLRRMTRGMYVSLDRALHGNSGGNYWRTQGGGFVRTSAVGMVRNASTFQGQALGEQLHLPVAFALSVNASTFQTNGRGGFSPVARVPRLTPFQLTDDPPVRGATDEYYRTREGYFVRSRQVRVVTAHAPPADLAPGEKWIDVNLDHQSVVAYVGATPVYVTVASTGRRNRSDPDENYETVQGGFRIQSKHVATTMDGNSANDGPYSIEDVPWVMYFEASFALHGAFWHEGYGMMRSHGCVNLAPSDARWFYNWTEPQVPPGWHAAYATPQRPGTRVYVHYDEQALGERGGPDRVPQH